MDNQLKNIYIDGLIELDLNDNPKELLIYFLKK